MSGEEIFKSICKVLEEIAEKITGIEEEILRQREKNITSSNNELLDYLNRTINLEKRLGKTPSKRGKSSLLFGFPFI